MDKYDIRLLLLRMALWNKTDCQLHDFIPSKVDWGKITNFFITQTLEGMLPDAVALLPEELGPTQDEKMEMISLQLQVAHKNSKVNEELLSFTEELEKRDIPHVLLKGQGVAALYPHPLHRVPGDIDLYVPIAYYARINRGMLVFGGERGEETRHHVSYVAREVMWELHHCIHYFQVERYNARFMQMVNDAIEESVAYVNVADGKVRVFPVMMDVLMSLAHILDHFYCSGVGLRQLCDFALLLDKGKSQLDRKRFLQALEDLSMVRAYRIFGGICVEFLGLDETALLLPLTKSDRRLVHRVMLDCMRGGNFGRGEHRGRGTFFRWLSYYIRFVWRLIKYGAVSPSEAICWPLAKLKRFSTGTVKIKGDKSVLKKM